MSSLYMDGRFRRSTLGLSDRRYFLLAAALTRTAWNSLTDRGRSAIEKVERQTDQPGFSAPSCPKRDQLQRLEDWAAYWASGPEKADQHVSSVSMVVMNIHDYPPRVPESEIMRVMEDFKDGSNAGARPGRQAKALAEAAYVADRCKEAGTLCDHRVGILADCLEEEGADDAIVSHLRSGSHWRGCWALDLVLGRK